ncbi:OmpP1/FadL family transporter [Stieleria varia]|uniref:Outer membrane protein transport protein (OMPP1/FadL/TodX) n=1 Tax=Stieleria varia TaxID=2528005 RepID=A0A5C6AGH8_9BACT|nr:outer membrane protein transport protein [Stieleria varia]TWT98527.1 Outer membrane protein transport protein (OMPP1/FadL/TodX) [Stieleria varia]
MSVRLNLRWRTTLVASLAMLISVSSSLYGDGILRDGIGAISTGRGGTNLGFADNGNVILDNPGALVNVDGSGLVELDLDLFITDLSYSDPDNATTSASNSPFPMGQLSVIRKLDEGNIAVGFGVFSHAGFSTHYTLNGPGPLAGPQNYKSVGGLMRILPSLSIALTPRLSIGTTLGMAVSHTELEGPYFTQAATPFRGTPTLLDLQATGTGLSWSLGAQYLLSQSTTLGMAFQAETHITADGSANLVIPGLGSSGFDMELETQWPSTLGVGVTHQANPCTTVAADVIWTRWSGAKSSYNMQLSDPSNPAFAFLGPSFPEVFPLNWRDSVALRLGAERSLGMGRVARAGYVYHHNVIPNETLTPFIQATVEHSLSFGYGWKVRDFGIDLGYQVMLGDDQTVGSSNFVGGDFDGSTSSASAHWFLASLTRRF